MLASVRNITERKAAEDALQRAYDELSAWDDTRLYIGNAGYGFGRAGEICDLHRYWGWYYNSFLSFYEMRDPRICWRTVVSPGQNRLAAGTSS